MVGTSLFEGPEFLGTERPPPYQQRGAEGKEQVHRPGLGAQYKSENDPGNEAKECQQQGWRHIDTRSSVDALPASFYLNAG